MPDTAASSTFPGWYQDHDQVGTERFWNGSTWTSLTRATAAELLDTSDPIDPELHDLLGPIDPSLQSLLDSFESEDYSSGERISRV
ncbi:MAG: DUF2510 domain-containing protein [Acidimicrobiales bacterium]